MQIAGKRAVVVGRSNIVGTPAAQLLQRRDATVTVVHSRTPDGAAICREADIVIAACGRAEMLTGDWIKPGAVVIDVGINAVDVSDCGTHITHTMRRRRRCITGNATQLCGRTSVIQDPTSMQPACMRLSRTGRVRTRGWSQRRCTRRIRRGPVGTGLSAMSTSMRQRRRRP